MSESDRVPTAADIERAIADAMAEVKIDPNEVTVSDAELDALLNDEHEVSGGASSSNRDAALFASLMNELSAQCEALRLAAVMLNRAGQKDEALSRLKSAKACDALKARLGAVHGGQEQSNEVKTLQEFLQTLPPLPPSVVSAPKVAAESSSSVPATPAQRKNTVVDQHTAQAAAKPVARPNPVLASASANIAASKQIVASTFQREVEEQRIVQRLESQIEQLTIEATNSLRVKQKEQAAVLVKRKAASMRDLELAKKLLVSNIIHLADYFCFDFYSNFWFQEAQQPLPVLQTERIVFERQHMLSDLEPETLVLRISKVKFGPAAAAQNYTPYVVVTLVEPDSDAEASAASDKFKSTTSHVDSSDGSAVFDHVSSLKFPALDAKRMRNFVKYRFRFEMFHRRMLWKHLRIGVTECKLKEVADVCEAALTLPIKDDDKQTIGELHVSLRVRTPLMTPQVQKVVIDFVSFVPAVVAAAPPAVIPAVIPAIVQPVVAPAVANATIMPVDAQNLVARGPPDAAAAAPAVAAATVECAVPEAHLRDPFSVDLLFGNNVLDAEIQSLQSRIAESKDGGQTIDLQLRLAIVQVKSNLLVSSVQEEKLSLPEYIADLKLHLESTKMLALELKKRGRLDEARQVLARWKIMKDEIESVPEQ
jgi:hypothetical protein